MKKTIYLFYLLVIACIVVLSTQAFAGDYVVINSKDWHDMYLAGVYAGYSDRTLLFFENLGEASLKSQLIPPGSDVLIFESNSQAVVKNYDSYLSARGITQTTKVTYDSYADFQFLLYNRLRFEENTKNLIVPKGFALFYSEYGIEAVAATSVIYDKKAWPLFVNRKIITDYTELLKGEKIHFAAGNFPIRQLQTSLFERTTVFSGKPDITTVGIATLTSKKAPSGIITRIDRIDPQMLARKVPTYVYYGSVSDVAAIIANVETRLFEVVSSDAADLSKSIEAASGRDLQLLVKYARGYTNLQGYEGQLIDLDTVAFAFPNVGLRLDTATYYPALGKITLTYTNIGTEPVTVLSTIEFADSIATDEFPKVIPAGVTMTIPYDAAVNSPSRAIAINTLYGESEPLTTNLLDANGQPIIRTTVQVADEAKVDDITILDAWLDDVEGILYIEAKNNANTAVKTALQVRIMNTTTTLGSTVFEIMPNQAGQLAIEVPYIDATTLSAPLAIYAYFGASQTVFLTNQQTQVSKVISPGSEQSNLLLYGTMSIIVIIIVVIGIVLMGWVQRKRRGF